MERTSFQDNQHYVLGSVATNIWQIGNIWHGTIGPHGREDSIIISRGRGGLTVCFPARDEPTPNGRDFP